MSNHKIELEKVLEKSLPKQFEFTSEPYLSKIDIYSKGGEKYLEIETSCSFRKYVVTFADENLDNSLDNSVKFHENINTLIQELFLNFPPKPSNSMRGKNDINSENLEFNLNAESLGGAVIENELPIYQLFDNIRKKSLLFPQVKKKENYIFEA